MSNLQNAIETLATDFTAKLLDALRGATIDELTAINGREVGNGRRPQVTAVKSTGGRLPRRSPDDLAAVVEQIAGLLAKEAAGMRAEQIRAALGIEKKELVRPIQDGLASGRFSKTGEKRATVYTLGKGKKAKRV